MRSLKGLVGDFPVRAWLGRPDVDVGGVGDHSARVRPGEVFVCIPGARADGHRFAAKAVARGATALITGLPLPLGPEIVQVVVDEPRRCLAHLAARWYEHPSAALALVGVTGTNGKTTTTYLIDAIARSAGRRTGLIGTVKVAVDGRERPAEHTTPGALELHGYLAEMVRSGVNWATIEVSSHSLVQARPDGCRFDVAAFTNLSRDHFDFHRDFERYFRAKRRLFELLEASPKPHRAAVLNLDDPFGLRLATAIHQADVVGFAIRAPARVRAYDLELTPSVSRFRLEVDGLSAPVTLGLPGTYNVYNALAAAAVAHAQGIPLETVVEGLETAPSVPGRWQVVEVEGDDITVVVDFAHNPGGLASVLALARQVARSRLIVVFGAPGKGDRDKRPLMGTLAARFADYCIITQDDSPEEDPETVALAVEEGLRRAGMAEGFYEIILNRPDAIERAIGLAAPGDLVLVCGRGHETHLAIKQRRIAMRDEDLVRRSLAARTTSVGLAALGAKEGWVPAAPAAKSEPAALATGDIVPATDLSGG